MNKQALSLAVCIAGAYPLSSGAIGLGDLRSSSHLNQPLNAKIELLSTSVQEAQQIQVRLASTDVFNRVGIDRPAYLNSLTFKSVIQNGKPVILVSSSQPIKEPFLNFLLEVSWPKGQLLKEYTVLLDPPVLLQSGTTTENNTASVRAEPTSVGFVKRPAPQAKPVNRQTQVQVKDGIKLPTPQKATPAAPQQNGGAQSKYRVKSGDTLYRIASKVKSPGINADQMMVALFRANPKAFRSNNLNRLKAGATLNVPSTVNAQALSSSKAKSLVRKHYSEWKQYRKNLAGKTVPQKQVRSSSRSENKNPSSRGQAAPKQTNKNARLEVMGNKSANKAQSSGKVSAAGKSRIAKLDKQLSLAQEALVTKKRVNSELRSRVTELESLVQKKSRLITLKNQQLAKLQASLSNSNSRSANTARTNQANSNSTAATSANAQNQTQSPANSVSSNLPAHLANRANQDAGKINRTELDNANTPPIATNSTSPAVNQNQSQAQQENLSPALLAAKRRAAAMQEKAKAEEAEKTDNTGFKPEKENALLGLLSSPIATAAGAGSILLLLLGWLLLSRRKDKAAVNSENVDAVVDDFSDDFSSLEEELNSEINTSNDDNDSFFDDLTDDEPKKSAVDTTSNLQTSNVSSALDSDDSDDILQEADVYIVYGLHEQAEAELKRAIKDNPNKLEYRHKLLENYLASNNKEAFDQQAQEIHDIDGSNKEEIWEKVIEMGRKISPDNTLYAGGNSSILSAAAGAAAIGATVAVVKSTLDDDSTSEALADDVKSEESLSDEFDIDDLLLDDAESNILPEADNETFELDGDTVLADDINELDNLDELDGDLSAFGLDDDFSLDDLEKELSEQSTELESSSNDDDNVVDFESMMLGGDAADSSNNDIEVANLNLNVDSDSGLDKILPKDTAYSSQKNDDSLPDDDDDILSFLDLPEDDDELHEAHISTKLDLARAYLDMGDIEGARSTLEEVIVEGSDDQKREAEDLLHQTG